MKDKNEMKGLSLTYVGDCESVEYLGLKLEKDVPVSITKAVASNLKDNPFLVLSNG